MAGAVFIAWRGNSNYYLLGMDKSEMPQYKFQKMICKSENPTLLNYGFLDGGFYTVCDIVPSEKFFCQLNIKLPEMEDSLRQAILEGRVQFVVTRNEILHDEKYQQIEEAEFPFEGKIWVYRLYERKS